MARQEQVSDSDSIPDPVQADPLPQALLQARWQQTWVLLPSTEPDRWQHCWHDLRSRYQEPHRAYHTLAHLADCFALWDQAWSQGRVQAIPGQPWTETDRFCLEMALWCHDVIYEVPSTAAAVPSAPSNEVQSAQWAGQWLGRLGIAAETIDRVQALIAATAHGAAESETAGSPAEKSPKSPAQKSPKSQIAQTSQAEIGQAEIGQAEIGQADPPKKSQIAPKSQAERVQAEKPQAVKPQIDEPPTEIAHPPDRRRTPDRLLPWLLDLDLAILGADPQAFQRYEAQIRQEYAAIPHHRFQTARRAILHQFLQRPWIYRTDYFRQQREGQARENLQRSIAAGRNRRLG